MSNLPIPPSHIARVDQIRAELADLVADAADHMASCDTTPTGLCLGRDVVTYIVALSCGERVELLQEAVAQLARAAGPDGESPRP
jgi:hypothetical protein